MDYTITLTPEQLNLIVTALAQSKAQRHHGADLAFRQMADRMLGRFENMLDVNSGGRYDIRR